MALTDKEREGMLRELAEAGVRVAEVRAAYNAMIAERNAMNARIGDLCNALTLSNETYRATRARLFRLSLIDEKGEAIAQTAAGS